MSTRLTPDELAFEKWWQDDGVFYDPDTDDVPWYDKRKELAAYAYRARQAELESQLAAVSQERDTMRDTLTRCQEECTKLLNQNRVMKMSMNLR